MGEWRTLKAEREYRGCLLRAGVDGAGYTWEVALAPGLRAGPAAGMHSGRELWPFAMFDGSGRPLPSIEAAQAAATQAADALALALSGWCAGGGTRWEPTRRLDRSERDAWRASVGGLTARLVLTEYGMGVLSLGPDGYGAARSEGFRPDDGEDVRAAADRLLRETAKAMGVADEAA